MPPDKDRLYIALYNRGDFANQPRADDSYYWAFIIGPKHEPSDGADGILFRLQLFAETVGVFPVGDDKKVWEYERRTIDLGPDDKLLVRVVIGKVLDQKRLEDVIRGAPRQKEDEPDWDSVVWAQGVVERVLRDEQALGKCAMDWRQVRDTAMWYVQRKNELHRFDGLEEFDTSKVPTWDMLKERELTE